MFGVKATHRKLKQALDRMGMTYDDYDPSFPPQRKFALQPRATMTPGEPYPPGYYTSQAVASLKFDRWIEGLGRKDKIVPRERFSQNNA